MRWRRSALAVLVLWPTLALADMGLPMLAVAWPMTIAAFFPVVLLEAWIVRRATGMPWRTSLRQMFKANLVSTLVGIPVTWVVLVLVEFGLFYLAATSGMSDPESVLGNFGVVVLASPWLGPFREGAQWIIPTAAASLLVPFFFASAWTETWIVTRSLSVADYPSLRPAIWRANLASYALLFFGCLGWLAYGLITNATK